ncbi:MAG TPA: helix-turn-helix domain-containing protein [Ornithinicoccus sp.]|nr:helix-turn-helix domain-containing protein [Ornithinicoccus sp.]
MDEPPFVLGPVVPGLVGEVVGYRQTGVEPTVHRGLPSPALTLILSTAGPVTGAAEPQQLDAGRPSFRHEALVAGLHTRPAFIVQPTVQAGIQLGLHPLASRQLLGVPAAELPGLAEDATAFLGEEVERVRQRVAEGASWTEAFAHVRSYLVARAGRRVPERPRAEVVAAWDWIARRRGRGSVDALARYVALSPRQLRTLFHREVGLGPKAVSGLFRFDHAKRLVATLPDGMTLAEVAQRCGYADQAHLVHDFRRYTGTTPSGWLAEERRNIQDGAYPDRTG